LFAPVVEGAGLMGLALAAVLGIMNAPFAILFFIAAYGFGAILTVYTLLLEEFTFRRYRRISDRVRLLAYALLEGLGYRQLTVIWRLRGLYKYLRGRTEWGVMERKGFQPATPVSVPANGSNP
jgi:hypothetical protein